MKNNSQKLYQQEKIEIVIETKRGEKSANKSSQNLRKGVLNINDENFPDSLTCHMRPSSQQKLPRPAHYTKLSAKKRMRKDSMK